MKKFFRKNEKKFQKIESAFRKIFQKNVSAFFQEFSERFSCGKNLLLKQCNESAYIFSGRLRRPIVKTLYHLCRIVLSFLSLVVRCSFSSLSLSLLVLLLAAPFAMAAAPFPPPPSLPRLVSCVTPSAAAPSASYYFFTIGASLNLSSLLLVHSFSRVLSPPL